MGITYFKRYRMELDLTRGNITEPEIPSGYHFLPWCETLVGEHAVAKYQSFRNEIDANVFPCLGDPRGCERLMSDISRRAGFIPSATWLIAKFTESALPEYCGTIQGIRDRYGNGSIQNVGVAPQHRGQGLSKVLLYKALEGFIKHELGRATLEVTAQNELALNLYERVGFQKVRTVYKAVEVAFV